MADAPDRATPSEAAEAERLRYVRALLEEVLREHDVCAIVNLAGREGRFETFTHVEASWSQLHLESDARGQGIRLRSKVADYAGDRERQKRELEWSVGVVSGLAHLLGAQALGWLTVAAKMDKASGAVHTPWRRDDPRDASSGKH